MAVDVGKTGKLGDDAPVAPVASSDSSAEPKDKVIGFLIKAVNHHWVIIIACSMVLVSVLAFFVASVGFLIFFYFHSTPLSGGSGVQAWADYSSAVMPMFQTVIGVATLAAALLVGVTINANLEERRRSDERFRSEASDRAARHRELIRLSEMMVNTDFYSKVTYPAWEVALKWLDGDGEPADIYRAQVVAGEVTLPVGAYLRHRHFSYFVREHPHNHPYDVAVGDKAACVMNELPEGLALATWIRFWRHIIFLIDQEIVEEEGVRKLFGEWYKWWAPFMAEYLTVAAACLSELKEEPGEDVALNQLIRLHRDVLKLPFHSPHEDDEQFKIRTDEMTRRILPHLKEAIGPQADWRAG